MKTASTLINPGESLPDEVPWQMEALEQTPASSYARDLRVVGQLLERRQITSADLVCVADAYIVRGIQRLARDSRFGGYFSRRLMKRLDAILHGDFRRSLRSGVIDLRYNLEEIVKFDYLARCKRSKISALPDPYSLSHILRSTGAYLDGRKNSSLIGISLQDQWVTIRFETAEGHPEEAKQNLQYFYDYWVKMYLRRGSQGQTSGTNLQRNSFVPNRPRIPTQSASTDELKRW